MPRYPGRYRFIGLVACMCSLAASVVPCAALPLMAAGKPAPRRTASSPAGHVTFSEPSATDEPADAFYELHFALRQPTSGQQALSLFYSRQPRGRPLHVLAARLSPKTTYLTWHTAAIPEGRYYIIARVEGIGRAPDVSLAAGTVRVWHAALHAGTWLTLKVPPISDKAVKAVSDETLRRNIDPKAPALYPSPSYGGVYLRDTFWATSVVTNASLVLALREQFDRSQLPSGQIPSYFKAWQRNPRYNDDESTMLYVLWMCRDWSRFHTPPNRHALNLAMGFIGRAAQDDYDVSPTGDGRSWLDDYYLAAPDTLSYNQGLYAATMECALSLGAAGVSRAGVDAVQRAYAALYRPDLGYLPLGRHDPATDVSSLTGEFVSQWLFDRPLLSDKIVLSTLTHLTATPTGYKVVSTSAGDYLDSAQFVKSLVPGDYQNGGTWLLYDYMALATGYLHGWQGARVLMRRRLTLDLLSGNHFGEYRCTNPMLYCYAVPDPQRQYTIWDTFILVIDRVVAQPLSSRST